MIFNYVILGKRIKYIRNKKGITQGTLAEKIDKSTSYISHIENGDRCMSLDTFVDIANQLNVSSDDLLIDSLVNTVKVSNCQLAILASDCSEYELQILLDVMKAVKQSLRQHRNLSNLKRNRQ